MSDSITGSLLKSGWVDREVCSLGWNYYETQDRILANRAGHISFLVKSWRLEMYRTHAADELTVYVKKMSEG